MNGLIKRMCILKQLKSGFSSDGNPLSGVVRVERYGKLCVAQLSLINFAPLSQGKYACILCDKQGERLMFFLNPQTGEYRTGDSLFNPEKGFCAVVCFLKNGAVECLAAGQYGSGGYNLKLLLNGLIENPAQEQKTKDKASLSAAPNPLENTPAAAVIENEFFPRSAQKNNVDFTQKSNVDFTQESNVDFTQKNNVDFTQKSNVDFTQNTPTMPKIKRENAPNAAQITFEPAPTVPGEKKKEGVFLQDDTVLTENNFENTIEKQAMPAYTEKKLVFLKGQKYDDEAISRDNYFQEARESESGDFTQIFQDENAYAKSQKEKTGGDNFSKNESVEEFCHPFKFTKGQEYFLKIKEELETLFATCPRIDDLTAAIPNSEWVQVKDAECLVGLIYEDMQVRYIAYALPAKEKTPPQELQEACFVPIDPALPTKGYFVLFQDAATGECVNVERG